MKLMVLKGFVSFVMLHDSILLMLRHRYYFEILIGRSIVMFTGTYVAYFHDQPQCVRLFYKVWRCENRPML